MTDAQLIPYLAGFFDGEGTISISHYKRDGGGYQLQIAVSQNERAPLEIFQTRFGGKIYSQKWEKVKRAFYSWQLTNREEKRVFLEAVSPFLIVKKREAEIALAFLATLVSSRWHGGGEGWRSKRATMFDEMRAIKHRRTLLGMKEARN